MPTWCRLGKAPPGGCGTLQSELTRRLAPLKIDVRPARRFERDTQKRRAQSRKNKLQATQRKRDAT